VHLYMVWASLSCPSSKLGNLVLVVHATNHVSPRSRYGTKSSNTAAKLLGTESMLSTPVNIELNVAICPYSFDLVVYVCSPNDIEELQSRLQDWPLVIVFPITSTVHELSNVKLMIAVSN
jgi:hypothetical protein